MMHGKLEVQDGFLILLAALWCVDTENVLPLFLFAAAVHEAGHLLVLYGTGGCVHRLLLRAYGAVLHCTLPEGRCARAAICLAGPAASFALTAVANAATWYQLAGASALLGAFNLLPMPPLDGGMVLYHLTDSNGIRIRTAISTLTTLFLFYAGWFLLRHGYGGWLLGISILLFIQNRKSLAKSIALM